MNSNNTDPLRQMDEVIEQRIEILSRLGLPLTFSSGLQEIADNSETSAEQLLVLASLELLLQARNTVPGSKEPSVRVVPPPVQELLPDQLHPKARTFMKNLLEVNEASVDATQAQAEGFLESLIAIHPSLRRNKRAVSPALYDELRLYVRGFTEADIALKAQSTSTSAIFQNRATFINWFHSRGYSPAKLRRMFDEFCEEQADERGVVENPSSSIEDDITADALVKDFARQTGSVALNDQSGIADLATPKAAEAAGSATASDSVSKPDELAPPASDVFELDESKWTYEIMTLCSQYWDSDELVSLQALLDGKDASLAAAARTQIAALMEKHSRFIPLRHIKSEAGLSITEWKIMSRLSGYGLKGGEMMLPIDRVRVMFSSSGQTFNDVLTEVFTKLIDCELTQRQGTVQSESDTPPKPANDSPADVSDVDRLTTEVPGQGEPDVVDNATEEPEVSTIADTPELAAATQGVVDETESKVPVEPPAPVNTDQVHAQSKPKPAPNHSNTTAMNVYDIAELTDQPVDQVERLVARLKREGAFNGTPPPVVRSIEGTGRRVYNWRGTALNKILDGIEALPKQ